MENNILVKFLDKMKSNYRHNLLNVESFIDGTAEIKNIPNILDLGSSTNKDDRQDVKSSEDDSFHREDVSLHRQDVTSQNTSGVKNNISDNKLYDSSNSLSSFLLDSFKEKNHNKEIKKGDSIVGPDLLKEIQKGNNENFLSSYSPDNKFDLLFE